MAGSRIYLMASFFQLVPSSQRTLQWCLLLFKIKLPERKPETQIHTQYNQIKLRVQNRYQPRKSIHSGRTRACDS